MTIANDTTELAVRALRHYAAGTTDQAPDISDLPVAAYLDEDRFKREFEAIFLSRPQGILLSIEVPEPGDYVARTYLGKPLLVARGKDGVARVFLNVCRHRGARVCAEGSGSAARFTCPYHAWTYDREGRLIGVSGASTFGEMDKATLGLTELSSQEAAGVIWATLTPGVDTDIDAWLGTMRHQLELLRLRECVVFSQRTIPSPGWKVTMPREKWLLTRSWKLGCGWSGVKVMQSWWAPPFHSAVKAAGLRISQPEVLAIDSGRQR